MARTLVKRAWRSNSVVRKRGSTRGRAYGSVDARVTVPREVGVRRMLKRVTTERLGSGVIRGSLLAGKKAYLDERGM